MSTREEVRRRCDHEHYQRNRDYVLNRGRDRNKRLSAIPGPRNYNPWTPDEDVIVMRDDLSTVEKAFILGRSYYSVSGRRGRLRHPDRSRTQMRHATRRYRARQGIPFQGGRPDRPEICDVEGCSRPHCARGWCNTHYARWKANGTVELPQQSPFSCAASNCSATKHKAYQLCNKHYQRWKLTGSIELEQRPRPVKTPAQPMILVCVECGDSFRQKRANNTRFCSRLCARTFHNRCSYDQRRNQVSA